MIERRKAKRVTRRLSDSDKAKYARLREAVEKEFPPGKAKRRRAIPISRPISASISTCGPWWVNYARPAKRRA